MRTISCGSMPTTSAGPRSRTGTVAAGTPLTSSAASSVTRAGCPGRAYRRDDAGGRALAHPGQEDEVGGLRHVGMSVVVRSSYRCGVRPLRAPARAATALHRRAAVEANDQRAAPRSSSPPVAGVAVEPAQVGRRRPPPAATCAVARPAAPAPGRGSAPCRCGESALRHRAEAHLLEQAIGDQHVTLRRRGWWRRAGRRRGGAGIVVDDDRLVLQRRGHRCAGVEGDRVAAEDHAASISSNDGLASFSSSLIAKNCPARTGRPLARAPAQWRSNRAAVDREAACTGDRRAAERVELARGVERHHRLAHDQRARAGRAPARCPAAACAARHRAGGRRAGLRRSSSAGRPARAAARRARRSPAAAAASRRRSASCRSGS